MISCGSINDCSFAGFHFDFLDSPTARSNGSFKSTSGYFGLTYFLNKRLNQNVRHRNAVHLDLLKIELAAAFVRDKLSFHEQIVSAANQAHRRSDCRWRSK